MIPCMADGHRNRYVLEHESGHPGYSNTVVYGTPEDLELLARKLAEAVLAPGGSLSEFATRKHGASSRVTLQFRAVDAAEIDLWHVPSVKSRFAGWVAIALIIGLLVLAWIGALSLAS